MTNSEADKNLIAHTENQITVLQNILSDSVERLKAETAEIIERNQAAFAGNVSQETSAEWISERQKTITRIINNIENILTNFSTASIAEAYKNGSEIANMLIEADSFSTGLDTKSINVLLKDIISDYSVALNGARLQVNRFFKLTKQNLLSESEISSAIATGYTEKGNLYGAKKALLQQIQGKLGEGKFIPIEGKDGKIRNYNIDKYAELVARTRIAEAQVQGSIDMAGSFGINTFRVTAHATKTAICAPHENRVYTTDPELIELGIFPPLDGNRPIYHPNCQHRLLPAPYTPDAIDRLKRKKTDPDKTARLEEADKARKEQLRLESVALSKAGIDRYIQEQFVDSDGKTRIRLVDNPAAVTFLELYKNQNQ